MFVIFKDFLVVYHMFILILIKSFSLIQSLRSSISLDTMEMSLGTYSRMFDLNLLFLRRLFVFVCCCFLLMIGIDAPTTWRIWMSSERDWNLFSNDRFLSPVRQALCLQCGDSFPSARHSSGSLMFWYQFWCRGSQNKREEIYKYFVYFLVSLFYPYSLL